MPKKATILCPKCKTNKRPTYPNGNKGAYCKQCESKRNQLRQNYNIQLLGRFKMMKGCANCGYKGHYSALQFDHIEPKLTGKRIVIAGMSKEKMKKELSLCQVLCANCHAIKTWKERKEGKYAIHTT